jgi:hypothetical protein
VSRFTLAITVLGITLLSAGVVWFTATRLIPKKQPSMRFFNAHSLWQALTTPRVFHFDVTLRARTIAIIVGLILLGLAALTLWAGAARLPSIRGTYDPSGLADTTPQAPGLERYSNPLSGFLFDYPATLSLSETDDNGSHVIFVDTADGETRLLIVISPYVLDEPLTEQMLRDQLNASDIASVTLPSGPTAILGRRSDTPLGPTQDAFFVHRGMLYQVSTTADLYDAFNGILATWRFED